MACFHFWPQLNKPEKPPLKPAKNGLSSRARAYLSTKSLAGACALVAQRLAGPPGFLLIGETFGPAGQWHGGPFIMAVKMGVCRRRRGGAFFLINIKEQDMNIYIFLKARGV